MSDGGRWWAEMECLCLKFVTYLITWLAGLDNVVSSRLIDKLDGITESHLYIFLTFCLPCDRFVHCLCSREDKSEKKYV